MSARRPRGQALVEFALLLPLLFLLLMGIVDSGRMLAAAVELEEAVQEGAMYAAFHPAPEADVIARVNGSSGSYVVTDAVVSVVCTTTPPPGTVVISAEIDYPLITPLISQLLGGSVNLAQTVTATNFDGGC